MSTPAGASPAEDRAVARSFTVTAVDETGPGQRDVGEVETTGTLAQRTSALPPDRPVTVRLDPTVVRTRNRGSAVVTAVVDNRGGSRARRHRSLVSSDVHGDVG